MHIGDACQKSNIRQSVPDPPYHPFSVCSVSDTIDYIFANIRDSLARSDMYPWSTSVVTLGILESALCVNQR